MIKKNQTDGKVPEQGESGPASAGANRGPKTEGEEGAERDLNLGAIGSQLRGLYKELLDEPIPDRFTELLKDLESKESGNT
jgi:Anti-sigma factor NepR